MLHLSSLLKQFLIAKQFKIGAIEQAKLLWLLGFYPCLLVGTCYVTHNTDFFNRRERKRNGGAVETRGCNFGVGIG